MKTMEALYEIIVADDELSVCELLRRGLNEDNFMVTAFTRPEGVVDAVIEKKPCLVIVDVQMPGLDGLEVLRRIKERDAEIPVVLISGLQDPETKAAARKLGACDFLDKPLNWNYLRNIAYLCSFLKEKRNDGGRP